MITLNSTTTTTNDRYAADVVIKATNRYNGALVQQVNVEIVLSTPTTEDELPYVHVTLVGLPLTAKGAPDKRAKRGPLYTHDVDSEAHYDLVREALTQSLTRAGLTADAVADSSYATFLTMTYAERVEREEARILARYGPKSTV